MRARHPAIWLMTDERADPIAAVRRLPPGSGVVFRHRATPRCERLRLFRCIRRIAHARGLTVVSAEGQLPGAAGVHGPGRGAGLRTWPVHDRRQAMAAKRNGAVIVFVSPVFATRSHPGACPLGPMRAARIAGGLGLTVIALGAVNGQRWRRIARFGFDGWAGIDAWENGDPSPRRGKAASSVLG